MLNRSEPRGEGTRGSRLGTLGEGRRFRLRAKRFGGLAAALAEAVSVDNGPARLVSSGKYLDSARLQIVAVGDGKKIGEGLKQFGAVEVYDLEGKIKTP